MKTKINDLTISNELVAFLHKLCPGANVDIDPPVLMSYVDQLIEIQDYMCRNLSNLPDTNPAELTVFFESIVALKDDLKKLNSLLPIKNDTYGNS